MTGTDSFQGAPERAIYEAVRVKSKLQWKPKDIGEARNKECLPRRAIGNSGTSPRDRLYGLQTARPQGQCCPSLLKLRSHHVPQMLTTELQNLMFSLMGFGLAFV